MLVSVNLSGMPLFDKLCCQLCECGGDNDNEKDDIIVDRCILKNLKRSVFPSRAKIKI